MTDVSSTSEGLYFILFFKKFRYLFPSFMIPLNPPLGGGDDFVTFVETVENFWVFLKIFFWKLPTHTQKERKKERKKEKTREDL